MSMQFFVAFVAFVASATTAGVEVCPEAGAVSIPPSASIVNTAAAILLKRFLQWSTGGHETDFTGDQTASLLDFIPHHINHIMITADAPQSASLTGSCLSRTRSIARTL
ncbi:MAG: hypothetical protein K8H87_04985 [Pseudorhodoplanes sp.]|nr:hypothetical protein [Pseudorhodoplanes sp.]